MSVHCDNPVGVLRNDLSVWIHTEGSHKVVVFLRLINDFALIHFVSNVTEYLCRQLHSNADIDPVLLLRHLKIVADPLHPGGTAASGRQHHILCPELLSGRCGHQESPVSVPLDGIHHSVEFHIDTIPDIIVDFPQYAYVAIRSQVAHTGLQQMKVVFETLRLQIRTRGGIQSGILAAHGAEHFIHVFHQFHRLFHADVLMQFSPELRRQIIFPVGQRSCTAVTVHDVTGIAFYAYLCFPQLNRADSFLQRRTAIQHQNPGIIIKLRQFIGHKYATGTSTNDNDIIIFHFLSLQSVIYLS